MSDENDTGDVEDTGEAKVASAKLMMARSIARSLWLPNFKAANPSADKQQVMAAWKAARQAQTKPVIQALRALEKKGFTFTAPAVAAGEDA